MDVKGSLEIGEADVDAVGTYEPSGPCKQIVLSDLNQTKSGVAIEFNRDADAIATVNLIRT
jgi:hypothetical protein